MSQKHFTLSYRDTLVRLLIGNKSKREIAQILGFSATTIYKEIKRNSNVRGNYNSKTAQYKSELRRKKASKKPKKQCSEIVNYVKEKLEAYWSPEQISGRMCKDLIKFNISFKTIYRWLKLGSYAKKGTQFTGYSKYLRIKSRGKLWGKQQNPTSQQGLKPHLPCIEQRPPADGFGHWECEFGARL